MKKTKAQKKWEREYFIFPERHPNLSLIISIIALVVSVLVQLCK